MEWGGDGGERTRVGEEQGKGERRGEGAEVGSGRGKGREETEGGALSYFFSATSLFPWSEHLHTHRRGQVRGMGGGRLGRNSVRGNCSDSFHFLPQPILHLEVKN